MATTYERIRQVLGHLESHSEERKLSVVAHEIRVRKLPEFRLRGTGNAIGEFISEGSISKLISLMSDLGLIQLADGRLTFRATDFGYASGDTTYARKIDLATKNLLSSKGVPLSAIHRAIQSITPPEVPDASTIYESLGTAADGVSQEMFAKLLYLLARAGTSISRTIHVHYHVD